MFGPIEKVVSSTDGGLILWMETVKPYVDLIASLSATVAIISSLLWVWQLKRHPLKVLHVLIEQGEDIPQGLPEGPARLPQPYNTIHVWVKNRGEHPVTILSVMVDNKVHFKVSRMGSRKWEYHSPLFTADTVTVSGGNKEVPPRAEGFKLEAIKAYNSETPKSKVYVTLGTTQGRLQKSIRAELTQQIYEVTDEPVEASSRIQAILTMHWLNFLDYLKLVSPCNREKM
jgi:hypothetical protein